MSSKKTKVGDVFEVKLNGSKKFFQYIANDLTQLNSDVIRAFKKKYSLDNNPELSEIIKDEVDFYAHCVVKLGLKINVWERVGNVENIGSLDLVLFRDTNDYGCKIGESLIQISSNWYVWKINDSKFTKIGVLEGLNRKAELGIVVNPYDIKDRMITGKYSFIYPGCKK